MGVLPFWAQGAKQLFDRIADEPFVLRQPASLATATAASFGASIPDFSVVGDDAVVSTGGCDNIASSVSADTGGDDDVNVVAADGDADVDVDGAVSTIDDSTNAEANNDDNASSDTSSDDGFGAYIQQPAYDNKEEDEGENDTLQTDIELADWAESNLKCASLRSVVSAMLAHLPTDRLSLDGVLQHRFVKERL